MKTFLKQNGKKYFLVFNPMYSWSSEQNNQSVNINAKGEATLLGKRNLRTVTISSFYPKKKQSFADHKATMKPAEWVAAIEKMKREGAVWLHLLDVYAGYVTIESFTWAEQDGTGDIYFTLEMKEYWKPGLKKVQKKTSQKSKKADGSGRVKPTRNRAKTYKVKKGDCLSSIAKAQMAEPDWRKLYEVNRSVIGDNPNIVKAGQVLSIP